MTKDYTISTLSLEDSGGVLKFPQFTFSIIGKETIMPAFELHYAAKPVEQ